jgi:hypothetical protein
MNMIHQTNAITIHTEWIITNTKPGDYPDWTEAFRSIEANHVPCAPSYWHRFLKSLTKKGVIQPLKLRRDRRGLWVENGHHRIWGALKLGIRTLPVTI